MSVDNNIERFITVVLSHKVGLSKNGILLDLSGETTKMSINFSKGLVTYTGTPIVDDSIYNIEFPYSSKYSCLEGGVSFDEMKKPMLLDYYSGKLNEDLYKKGLEKHEIIQINSNLEKILDFEPESIL